MRIASLQIKNMRCFSEYEVAITAPYVLIAGENGSGKTSLFEALHYACYLRSFRTHTPRELIRFNQSHFFIKVIIEQHQDIHEVQVGYSHRKKIIKIDQQPIKSYKQLIEYYRIITLTQDDLILIKDGPDERRLFMDQALLLEQPEMMKHLKRLKVIVQNRNAFLQHPGKEKDHLASILTQQLFEVSCLIEKERRSLIQQIQHQFSLLWQEYGHPLLKKIELVYKAKNSVINHSFDEWFEIYKQQMEQEYLFGRSLFGAHLDDLEIRFQGQSAKHFASRGQQKLILVFLKLAQFEQLKQTKGDSILLIDDFMNDFDEQTAQRLLYLISQRFCQTFFTSPLHFGFFERLLAENHCQRITLAPDTAVAPG